jgi:cytochrome c-type biogenesis protein CcsB
MKRNAFMRLTAQWVLVFTLAVPSGGIRALTQAGHAHEEQPAAGGSAFPLLSPQFGEEVDVGPLRTLAVYHNGRVKIIDTLAREILQEISGRPNLPNPQTGSEYDPVFTYFDLIFRHELYLHSPVVYVKNKEVRKTLLQQLPEDGQRRWTDEARLAPHLFSDPAFQQSFTAMLGDAIKTQALNQVGYSLQRFLQVGGELLLVPPEKGSDRWVHIEQIPGKDIEPASGVELWSDAGPGDEEAVIATYMSLATAWRAGDVTQVNQLVHQLAVLLPSLRPESYPAAWRRTAELLYNRTARFTYAYIAYLLAFLSLVIGLAAGRHTLVRSGVVLLSVAFVLHTLGMITRIALSERPWAIHNQFESFFMLSWFGVSLGLLFLFLKRQHLYGAAAAGVGAVTLLIMNTTPIPSSEIAPVAPILINSRILYVHVNIMIVSYSLITLGFIISCFYLATYYLRGSAALALAGAGGTGGGLTSRSSSGTGLHDLESAQKVVFQMIFWLLIVGILLGAYWADHSWGRWWGWDPKETWALMTWIVYLAAVHLRFIVARPGLVMAWMSVLGFLMMLWNHWGVNLLLAGLHSYA